MSAECGVGTAEWKRPQKVLVCFAVKEEAAPFREWLGKEAGITILLTGMGRRNAERSTARALEREKPDLVLTCGFAGGLRPGLESGAVLYETDDQRLKQGLQAAAARPGHFLFSSTVATSAIEKRALWEKTKADAVEMESESIRRVCAEHGMPSATLRVVLDTTEEDLPLDFNALMTPEKKMNYAKLAMALTRSPAKIPALLRLQKQSRAAAEKLATVLLAVLGVRHRGRE